MPPTSCLGGLYSGRRLAKTAGGFSPAVALPSCKGPIVSTFLG